MNGATDRWLSHDKTSVLRLAAVCCAVAASLAVWPGTGSAQDLTPAEAQAIARDAYIYGYPIVETYKTMYGSAIDQNGEQFDAPLNTLKHRSKVFAPGNTAITTPNIDTPYSLLWMDLRTEPLVLSVPEFNDDRYYSIQFGDLYHYAFAYIGSRATGNKAGQYLIAGPNWSGQLPPNVKQVIRCETQFAMAIYRTQLRGPDDVENVTDLQAEYTVQTLSRFLGEPAPAAAPAVEFPPPTPDAKLSLDFFSTLGFLLKFCPPHTSDRDLMTRLGRIGLTTGTPFSAAGLSPEIQAAMQLGLDEGNSAVAVAATKLKTAEVIGTRDYLGGDYLKRAVAARLGRFSNAKEETLYPLYLSDATGKLLDASTGNYILKLGVAEIPPVNAFWSITMYDAKSKTLVSNPIGRYQIDSSMLPALERDGDNNDGLTLYLQNQAPPGEQTANWLPTPNGPFYMVMRLYWPKQQAYDGTWVPPLVWPQDSATEMAGAKPAGAESAEEVKPLVLIEEPKPEMERPTIWGEPTEVQIVVYIIDVDEIDSADQSFAASVYFEARWRNTFLRHNGPGPIHRSLTDVWNPRLMILGQQASWKSYPESVEIQPDGIVSYRQRIWGRFSQPLMLRDFPFDSQGLSIHIVAAGLSEKDVKMVSLVTDAGRTSSIANKFSLPDFDVVSWEAAPAAYHVGQDKENGVAGYEMKIGVVRQPTYYILKVLIPLCLIVIMSWLPRWIDPEQSGTNIGVSTSAFLTLVAYLFAITVLLPRVSYVTRIDRFILLSTLMVFAGLIQTVASTVMIKKQKKQWVDRADRWARFVYPIVLVMIIVMSFVL